MSNEPEPIEEAYEMEHATQDDRRTQDPDAELANRLNDVEVPEPKIPVDRHERGNPPTEQERILEYNRLVREAGQRTLCESYARLDVKPVGQGVDEGLFRALIEVRALPLPTEPS